MAVVVNDRDVQLEATSPRVAGVTMAPNIVVDPSNVTGLGLVILASKTVSLGATSQFFQISKTGVVSPSSTTIVAEVKNLVGTPSLTIAPGGGTMTVVPALTLGVFTFTEDQMLSESLTLQLEVIEDGIPYIDTMTVIKVREGSDGVNALLTNENVILPADYLGNVTNYSGADGQFVVFQGENNVTSVCTFGLAPGGNPQGLTYTLDAAGPTAGNYVITGGFPSAATVAKITFRATFGTTLIDKTFTVSKSIAGAPGSRGSRTFYITLDGTANTFDTDLATTAASADGGPVLLDTVVESNDSEAFSETRFWDGGAWTVVNAVVDGNLLVSGTVGANKVVTHSLTSDQIQVGGIIADSIAAATITGDKIVANTLTAVLIDTTGLDIKDGSGTTIFSATHALDFTNISNTLGTTLSIDAVTGAGFRAGTATWDSSGNWVSGFGVAMTPGGITAWDSAGTGTVKFHLDATTGDAFFAGTLAVGTATKSSATGSASSNSTVGTAQASVDSGQVTLLSGFVNTGKVTTVHLNANVEVQTHTGTNCYAELRAVIDGTEITVASGYHPKWQSDSFNTVIQASGTSQIWGVTHNVSWTFQVTPSAGSHNYGCIAYVTFYDNSGTATPISGSTVSIEGMVVVVENLA